MRLLTMVIGRPWWAKAGFAPPGAVFTAHQCLNGWFVDPLVTAESRLALTGNVRLAEEGVMELMTGLALAGFTVQITCAVRSGWPGLVTFTWKV
jgi:hypothetical protein